MEDEEVLTEDDTNQSEQGDDEQLQQILIEEYYKSKQYRASIADSFRVPWSRVRVGQSGLETLRAVAANPNNALDLLQQYHNSFYSEDERERCEIIEYVPPLAFLLSEEGSSGELRPLISSHLVPLITKALDDENSQVVNMAESALLSLLKHCLISSSYIERKIWPAIESRINKRQNVDGTIVNVVSVY